MSSKQYTEDDLRGMAGQVVLLQGTFTERFFDLLKVRSLKHIFVLEGRPSLDSSKATCRELLKREMTPTIISDNMAGFLFYKGLVKEVWIAYQLKHRRGALCQIGANLLDILAKRHHVPVYLFEGVPVKGSSRTMMAEPEKLIEFEGTRVAPKKTAAYVPLFEDVSGFCYEMLDGITQLKVFIPRDKFIQKGKSQWRPFNH